MARRFSEIPVRFQSGSTEVGQTSPHTGVCHFWPSLVPSGPNGGKLGPDVEDIWLKPADVGQTRATQLAKTGQSRVGAGAAPDRNDDVRRTTMSAERLSSYAQNIAQCSFRTKYRRVGAEIVPGSVEVGPESVEFQQIRPKQVDMCPYSVDIGRRGPTLRGFGRTFRKICPASGHIWSMPGQNSRPTSAEVWPTLAGGGRLRLIFGRIRPMAAVLDANCPVWTEFGLESSELGRC